MTAEYTFCQLAKERQYQRAVSSSLQTKSMVLCMSLKPSRQGYGDPGCADARCLCWVYCGSECERLSADLSNTGAVLMTDKVIETSQ